MPDPQSQPHRSLYRVHWQLLRLPEPESDYAEALVSAALSDSRPLPTSQIDAHDGLEVVSVWLELLADDLASAVERACMHVFGLIDAAGVPQPGRVELIAARPVLS